MKKEMIFLAISRYVLVILLMCILASGRHQVQAKGYVSYGKMTYKGFSYSYKVGTNSVQIDKYSGNKKTVVIPSKIKGRKVTELEGSLFSSNHKIEKLVIPEGVEIIGAYAFYDMTKLKEITFPASIMKFDGDTGLLFYKKKGKYPNVKITAYKNTMAGKYLTKEYMVSPGATVKLKKTNKAVLFFDVNKKSIQNYDGDVFQYDSNHIYTKNKKIGKLPELSAKGYIFKGWYTKKKGGKRITKNTIIKKNMQLYARWQPINKFSLLSEPRMIKTIFEDTGSSIHLDKIRFGKYKKCNLEWVVLKLDGKKAFVLCDYLVDSRTFKVGKYDTDKYMFTEPEDCTWETSNIREWLNGDDADSFYSSAFNETEKNKILSVEIDNNSGNKTMDKIFLLSQDEWNTEQYYLKYYGPYTIDGHFGDYEKWWLRTMPDPKHAYVIGETGLTSMDTYKYKEDDSDDEQGYLYVRPAMWVDLSDESCWDYAGYRSGSLDY